MEIHRTNNVNFGSRFKLKHEITGPVAKLISEKLNTSKLDSPYQISVINGEITHITSILDKNDCLVKSILEENGIKIASEETALKYFTRIFQVRSLIDKTIINPANEAKKYITSFE
jgi:hypothetical protein